MSQVNFAIRRGERAAQVERPASLTYDGLSIPCSIGNLNSYQRLKPDGGGFQTFQGLFVKILRVDIPPEWSNQITTPLHRGQNVTITNNDSESPGYGETTDMVIGENNQFTAQMVMLNLESIPA